MTDTRTSQTNLKTNLTHRLTRKTTPGTHASPHTTPLTRKRGLVVTVIDGWLTGRYPSPQHLFPPHPVDSDKAAE